MKAHLTRRIPVGAAVVLALVLLVLAIPVSASPDAPNPGHLWTELENHGTATGTYWLGTTTDDALELRVNGDRALRLEYAVDGNGEPTANVIGGYGGNSVSGGVYGATIGGGGTEQTMLTGPNRVTDAYGTVSGGMGNRAGDMAGTSEDAILATVGGGFANRAEAAFATVAGGTLNHVTDDYGTVGGGGFNQAGDAAGDSTDARYATVGGGYENTAEGLAATVGGGESNEAPSSYSTVPGGYNNRASGAYSFAAGRNAYASYDGCFVWADSQPSGISCSRDDRFVVRANGGISFYVNNGESVEIYDDGRDLISTSAFGARLTLAGVWTNGSDAASKENFSSVDGQEVLASLAEMPITTWNSKVEDASIRHMGPTAQDFYAAFALGDSDTTIGTLDADGVALAAIQGLYDLSQEQAARIEALEGENAALHQQLGDLESRVSALEDGTGLGSTVSAASSSGLPSIWVLLAGGLGLIAIGLVLAQRRLAGGTR